MDKKIPKYRIFAGKLEEHYENLCERHNVSHVRFTINDALRTLHVNGTPDPSRGTIVSAIREMVMDGSTMPVERLYSAYDAHQWRFTGKNAR